MRLEGGRESGNVEDRRGQRRSARRIGWWIGNADSGGDCDRLGRRSARPLLQNMQQGQQQHPEDPAGRLQDLPDGPNDELKKFVSVVLGDTEDVWGELFQAQGQQYTQPKLVLFTGQAQSACGFASTAMGPFYCPGDQKVYIDLAFYDELKARLEPLVTSPRPT